MSSSLAWKQMKMTLLKINLNSWWRRNIIHLWSKNAKHPWKKTRENSKKWSKKRSKWLKSKKWKRLLKSVKKEHSTTISKKTTASQKLTRIKCRWPSCSKNRSPKNHSPTITSMCRGPPGEWCLPRLAQRWYYRWRVLGAATTSLTSAVIRLGRARAKT